MKSGIPLDDLDRLPWLHKLRTHALALIKESKSISTYPVTCVMASSALKRSYRDILRGNEEEDTQNLGPMGDQPRVCFIFLKGSPLLIRQRIIHRSNHFMGPEILDSQLDTLEEPDLMAENFEGHRVITIPLSSEDGQVKDLNQLVNEILNTLKTYNNQM